MPSSSAPASPRLLSLVAAVSGLYDGLVGLVMLTARPWLAHVFAVPLPQPPIHADLNGVFLLAVALGYALPYSAPQRYRGYLWVMGPFLKGAGALTFVIDHVVRHSPPAFLLFAASDGTLALVTLWALWKVPASAGA
ncbi:MAG: hypothetical protein KGN76_08765 [Acidobacteriota bacterium]|nr:hypothetical protein [Acidobacteriota bacterium]